MPIEYQTDGHVATITINRPEALNALDPESMAHLRDRFIQARDDRNVRVIVLTGAGDRAFCSGADLKHTLPPAASFAEAFWLSDQEATTAGIYVRALDLSKLDLWKPVVAAINGHCVGGGLEVALQCDIRVASPNATFGLTEAKVASIPAVGGLQRLLRAIPSAMAMKMVLTGNRIPAEEARRIGLVSDIFPLEELVEAARQIACEVAGNGPLAVQAIKRLAQEGYNMPLHEALLMEQMTWGILRDTHDRVEGRKAFAEKRKPQFEGR